MQILTKAFVTIWRAKNVPLTRRLNCYWCAPHPLPPRCQAGARAHTLASRPALARSRQPHTRAHAPDTPAGWALAPLWLSTKQMKKSSTLRTGSLGGTSSLPSSRWPCWPCRPWRSGSSPGTGAGQRSFSAPPSTSPSPSTCEQTCLASAAAGVANWARVRWLAVTRTCARPCRACTFPAGTSRRGASPTCSSASPRATSR